MASKLFPSRQHEHLAVLTDVDNAPATIAEGLSRITLGGYMVAYDAPLVDQVNFY
ncbi:hypothetical protein SAMN05216601_11147 [Ectopseudomonas composti]|uniref:Uncharacterized protein n=1 Tax=Ectopseudomonas composti TaxID=658457 RepID=A0A1I5Q8J9_9GAMM|nr:hypothetical protein [Pseudomonas composti]SFP42331.1 hypothetical protein SAMN05216601_11147 [Pseudomonas composti]